MMPPFQAFVERFNRGATREALDPLEERWRAGKDRGLDVGALLGDVARTQAGLPSTRWLGPPAGPSPFPRCGSASRRPEVRRFHREGS